MTRTPHNPSRSQRVAAYLRHARQFGDPRSVRESAVEELSAVELGYLVSQLRKVKPIQENAGYWIGDGRNRHFVPWPRFQLAPEERDRLARRLLAEGVDEKVIAVYCGATQAWVRRLAESIRRDADAAELLAKHGPLNLLDGLNPVIAERMKGIMGLGPESACSTRMNTGVASAKLSIGDRFGRLAVLDLGRNAKRQRVAVCRCECGTTKTIRADQLAAGKTKSCGCLARERREAMQTRRRDLAPARSDARAR